MIRIVAIVAALVVCAAGVEVAVYGAGQLGIYLQTHMVARWFAPACILFPTACSIIVGLRQEKKMAEEEPMSPVVRRNPKTGLRQL